MPIIRDRSVAQDALIDTGSSVRIAEYLRPPPSPHSHASGCFAEDVLACFGGVSACKSVRCGRGDGYSLIIRRTCYTLYTADRGTYPKMDVDNASAGIRVLLFDVGGVNAPVTFDDPHGK